MADMRTRGEKLLWTSSRAKITPARGALKAAESPADAPLDRKSRSSTFPRFWRTAIPLPAAAPIWTDGPSLPREKPRAMASPPPRNFAASTFHQDMDTWPRSSPSTWGMPLPLAIGSHSIRSPMTTAAAHQKRTTAGRGTARAPERAATEKDSAFPRRSL